MQMQRIAGSVQKTCWMAEWRMGGRGGTVSQCEMRKEYRGTVEGLDGWTTLRQTRWDNQGGLYCCQACKKQRVPEDMVAGRILLRDYWQAWEEEEGLQRDCWRVGWLGCALKGCRIEKRQRGPWRDWWQALEGEGVQRDCWRVGWLEGVQKGYWMEWEEVCAMVTTEGVKIIPVRWI